MASANLKRLVTYVSQKEFEEILKLKKRTGLSRSTLMRRLMTNRPLPDFQKKLDLREMMGLRADLARLGNLLKYAIDHEDFERTAYNKAHNVSDLMLELEGRKAELSAVIKKLNSS